MAVGYSNTSPHSATLNQMFGAAREWVRTTYYSLTSVPAPVAAPSKTRTVLDRSNSESRVRIPLEAWMYVRAFLRCVVLCR